MTQAVAFLILCLAACNERESTTALYCRFGASVSKCYVMLHLSVPEVNVAQLLRIAEEIRRNSAICVICKLLVVLIVHTL